MTSRGRVLPTPGQPPPGSRGGRGGRPGTSFALSHSVSGSGGLMGRGQPAPAQGGRDGGYAQLWCRGVEVSATKPETNMMRR